ncbi:hypothetical protein FQ320_24845 [Oceaniovalibus sp. ACAM 378]|nr:hypothetical protein FQ320_24845 [Oceaniovalibus sp. ACAM 378]
MKLTFHNRTEVLGSRYEEADPSNEPNRPHISSDTRDFKERGDKTHGMCQFLSGTPRWHSLRSVSPPVCKPPRLRFRPPRLVPATASLRRR